LLRFPWLLTLKKRSFEQILRLSLERVEPQGGERLLWLREVKGLG
jgi:hypothetical protein